MRLDLQHAARRFIAGLESLDEVSSEEEVVASIAELQLQKFRLVQSEEPVSRNPLLVVFFMLVLVRHVCDCAPGGRVLTIDY